MSTAKGPERQRSRPNGRTAMDEGFLKAFVAIARTVSQSLSLEAVLNTTLELTLADPRVEAGEIYLLDEKSGELSFACQRGLSEECVQEAKEMPIKLGEGITGHVAVQKEPLLVSELSEEPRFLREMPEKEYRSLISLPIKSGDRVYGVINLFSSGGHRLSPRYVGRLAASVEMLGIAFEYVQLIEALRDSEERHHRLIEDINDGYVLLDIQEGKAIFANARCAEIVGYTVEEIIGQPLDKFIPPEAMKQVAEQLARVLQGEAAVERFETEVINRQGISIPVEVSTKIAEHEGRVVSGAIIRDITERKRAEEALRESERDYRILFESTIDGKVVIDAETMKAVLANQTALEMYGLDSVEELAEANLLDYIHPDDRDRAVRIIAEDMFEKDLRQVNEFRTITKDGRERWLSAIGTRVEYQGKLAGLASFTDITERKRAEEALRESEERHRRLIEDINDGYVVIQGMRIVFANTKMAQMLGYQTEELVGADYDKFLLPEVIAEADVLRTLAQRGALPERYEAQGVRKDGSRVTFELSFKAIDYEGEPAAAVIVRDITERKRAEEAIIQQAERLAVTAELTRIMVSSLDIEEVFDAFAAGVRRLVDFDRASIALIEWDRLRFLVVSSDVAADSGLERELGTGSTIPLEETATEWVVKNKRTNIETDFAQSMQFPTDEALYKEGLRSAICLPLFSRGEVFGTFNLSSRHPNAYGEREAEILEELAGQMAVAIQNDRLFAEVKQGKEELETAYDQLMASAQALDRGKRDLEEAYLSMARTLVLTLEARDPYTRGHSERVAQLCRQIAFEMGSSHEEVKAIETAARLHDLGKVGIPDAILLKPGPITPSERAEIQLHPTKAVELLRFLSFLDGVLPAIEGHHERYNGRGYPDSLKEEEAPLGARILAVADAYDAMTSARPYRPPMTSDEAIEELKKGAGTQWDPKVVEAFLRTVGK